MAAPSVHSLENMSVGRMAFLLVELLAPEMVALLALLEAASLVYRAVVSLAEMKDIKQVERMV